MIGSATGARIGITGLGTHVPERILTNAELARIVDTSDEWILERTGIRERRIAAKDEALTDIARPAALAALADAGVEAGEIDLVICATVTPDMMFPTSSAILADELGMPKAAAYDLLAGCTGFVYALAQAYGMLASGLSRRSLVIGGDVLSKILDWEDRSTLVLFGDGAGAVVMEPVEEGGFLGFELGADGGGGENLWLPGSGSRHFDDPEGPCEDERPRGLQVRDPNHGVLRRADSRRMWKVRERCRRVHPPSGEQADHRLRGR